MHYANQNLPLVIREHIESESSKNWSDLVFNIEKLSKSNVSKVIYFLCKKNV